MRNPSSLASYASEEIRPFAHRLPALDVFREWVEIERRKTQRRLLALGSMILACVVALLSAAAVLAIRFLGRVEGTVARIERTLADAIQAQSVAGPDRAHPYASFSEMQSALESIRARLDQNPALQTSVDLRALASRLETLQAMQELRAQMTVMAAQIADLETQAEEIRELRRNYTNRLLSWRAALRSWEARWTAHTARRLHVQAALVEWEKPAPRRSIVKDLRRKIFGAQTAAPEHEPHELVPVRSALDEIGQLKSSLAPLAAEFELMEREAVELDEMRREIQRRSSAWRDSVAELTSRVVEWRSAVAALLPERAAQ